MSRSRLESARAAATGALLGFFIWVGYRELSIIDPFEAHHLSGYLFLALACAALFLTRYRTVVWAIAGAVAFMMLLVIYTPIMKRPAQALIRTDRISGFDAVVVLSSGISEDDVIDQQGMDRLLTGLELARRGVPIVLTSIRTTGMDDPHFSASDQIRLVRLARHTAGTIETNIVWNTHDEAIEVKRLARKNGWKRVALVTSPLHTRRACAAFEKQGVPVVCVPATSRDLAVRSLHSGDDRLRAFQLWLYESLATSEYQRRGWL